MKFIANIFDLKNHLGIPVNENEVIKTISIDTRTIKKHALFIAIKGKNFDGNNFVDDAISKGANIVIADQYRYRDCKNKKIIYVKDTITALRKISKSIIKQYKGNVIAITGSNGKTSTTDIIFKTLKNSSKTIKNYNNEIGLPLSIMNASKKSNNLVFEIGASKFKDISYLSSILKPHIGIITNIGHSHLEALKNIEGVFKVKSEIVRNIRKNGFLIVPGDNKDHLKRWKKIRTDINLITFGGDIASDFYPTNIKSKSNELSFSIESHLIKKPVKVKTSLEGEHNIKNIIAAFAVHYCLKQDLEIFSKKLNSQKFNLRQTRSKWIRGSILIDDSYNANPDSTKKSIDLLSKSNKNTILLLGDMLELGRFKNKLHREIGEYAKIKGINHLLGYGNLTKETVKSFGKGGLFFRDKEELKDYLKKNIKSKDIVLIKGSRGMKMERFINV